MNLFSQCCGNSDLWMLIILLVLASCCGGGLENALSGSALPVTVALVYSMWKNGTLCNILCGNNGNGCGCN